ncbi:MAG: nucleotide exchange factor GrpE [Nanoarchaeota archaeon]
MSKKHETKKHDEKEHHPMKDELLTSREDEIKDLVNQLQRLQAEFENYKKRILADQERFCQAANEGLIVELLSVIDNFDLALKNETHKGEFYKGIEMIYSELYDILEKAGLEKINVEGQRFDPRLHEALLTEASDEEPGTILEEIEAGYTLNGKVIVHTKVKVAKKPDSHNDHRKDDKKGTAPEGD